MNRQTTLTGITATIFKADPLDPARGKRYREKILVPGGSREELDSLKVTLSATNESFPDISWFCRTFWEESQTARLS